MFFFAPLDCAQFFPAGNSLNVPNFFLGNTRTQDHISSSICSFFSQWLPSHNFFQSFLLCRNFLKITCFCPCHSQKSNGWSAMIGGKQYIGFYTTKDRESTECQVTGRGWSIQQTPGLNKEGFCQGDASTQTLQEPCTVMCYSYYLPTK